MMISAVGRKKNTAASTHRLMDDVPLCAAAAIQRGPSTAAMLNSSTSQKPMARRNCDCGAAVSSAKAIHSFPLMQRRGFLNERHHSILPGIQACLSSRLSRVHCLCRQECYCETRRNKIWFRLEGKSVCFTSLRM